MNRLRRTTIGAICSVGGILGCARTYVPEQPKVASAVGAAVAIDGLRVAAAGTEIDVRLLIATPAKTRLWGARLALREDRPCDAGLSLTTIQMDGVPIAEGPIDVGGQHEIDLTFGGQHEEATQAMNKLRKSATQPVYIDLSLEDTTGERRCARTALIGDPLGPHWQLSRNNVGAFLAASGRVYPVGLVSQSDLQPTAAFGERFGGILGPSRLWFDFAGAATNRNASRYVLLSMGADHSLWRRGDYNLRGGLGYDLALNFYRPGADRNARLRYTLQGPRASLGLSYTLIRSFVLPNLSTHPALPATDRNLSLELEVPVSLWFGAGSAPRATIVPGVVLGLSWAF